MQIEILSTLIINEALNVSRELQAEVYQDLGEWQLNFMKLLNVFEVQKKSH